MPSFRKAFPGQQWQPSAGLHNATVDLINANRHRTGAGDATALDRHGDIVTIKNTTEETIGMLGILGIDGAIFTPEENVHLFKLRVLLKGVTPTVAAHEGKFAIALSGIAPGRIGQAFIAGSCPVRVNVLSAGDGFAEVKDGDITQLESRSGGGSARILYKESGTGTKLAYVLFGSPGSRPIFQYVGMADFVVAPQQMAGAIPFAVNSIPT